MAEFFAEPCNVHGSAQRSGQPEPAEQPKVSLVNDDFSHRPAKTGDGAKARARPCTQLERVRQAVGQPMNPRNAVLFRNHPDRKHCGECASAQERTVNVVNRAEAWTQSVKFTVKTR